MRPACPLWFLLFMTGCGDPLRPVELIEEFRVLGARIEVDGEPERASLAPGENGRARFVVAAPDARPSFSYHLELCPSTGLGSGIPSCDAPVLAVAERSAPEPGELVFDFSLPEGYDVVRFPWGLIHGELCPDSAVSGSSCAGGEPGREIALEFLLEGADTNHNPTLAADALSFDGAAWPSISGDAGPCADDGVAAIAAPGTSHEIILRLTSADRDDLVAETKVDPLRESLLVSHFVTAGSLERAFSEIAAAADELFVSLRWTAPEFTEAAGTSVRFFFVVRDGRGGADFTTRGVCVVP